MVVPVKVLEGPQEGLLGCILGRFGHAQHPVTQVVDVGLIGLHKLREGFLASMLGLHDQNGFVLHSFSRPSNTVYDSPRRWLHTGQPGPGTLCCRPDLSIPGPAQAQCLFDLREEQSAQEYAQRPKKKNALVPQPGLGLGRIQGVNRWALQPSHGRRARRSKVCKA